MKASSLLAGVAALVVAGFAAPSRANGTSSSMEHEATLQGGEKLLIAYHRNKAVEYRFCVREQPGSVALKVLHDGETTEVRDGECQTVAGKHIDVMADTRMRGGDEMVLRFKRAAA